MQQKNSEVIRGLIFDLDGTLANTEMQHYRAWRKTLMANGVVELSMETFLTYVGTSNEKVAGDHVETFGLEKTVEELVREKQAIYMEAISEIELFSGVREFLQQFYKKLPIALATSSHCREAVAILKAKGILDFFDKVIGGDMVEKRKPDPEIYLQSCDMLGLPPASCVAFEDSTHGVESAHQAGMYVVAIPNSFTKEHYFSGADIVVQSIAEIDVHLQPLLEMEQTKTVTSL